MPWTEIAAEKAADNKKQALRLDKKRTISYRDALREALFQALEIDRNVFIMGEGVDDSGGVFGSTLGLHKKFPGRVFDTPIAENALTGFAIGAALCGMRPVLVHMRMDFLPVSFDQISNHAAKLRYMSGGKAAVPVVIRSIIGKGWGSAAQHSQALHALFLHMPGVKVAMPSSAYDAKGLLLSSIRDNDPVIFIEHRWLYDTRGPVPAEEYLIPFGKGAIRRRGKDATIIALSLMVSEALKAAEELRGEGISAEVIDPRTLNPFDENIVINSVKKTGRLIIADLGWRGGGFAEIILGRLHNKIRRHLKSEVRFITLPNAPAPNSPALEKAYYPGSKDIIREVKAAL